MNRVRRPPLQHPLAPVFDRAVDSLGVALSPDTTRHYRGTARNFLSYLGADHPEVKCLDQLRREPHILGWMSRLHAQTPTLATESYINLLIGLRGICNELAWTEQLSELAHLIRREDIPRFPQRLPRPLTTEQDELLQKEFLRRNDLGGNAFLLIRHTGMRIGECADLSFDCLRSTGPNQWAVHVPLGKLKTERMVPVDSFVCELVQRLRFFRSLDSLAADGRLLARPNTKAALVRHFRDYMHQVCHALGLSTRIVPHQLRHTYASEIGNPSTIGAATSGLRFDANAIVCDPGTPTPKSSQSSPATSPPTEAIPLSETSCAAAQTHARPAHTNASPREPQPSSAQCSKPASR